MQFFNPVKTELKLLAHSIINKHISTLVLWFMRIQSTNLNTQKCIGNIYICANELLSLINTCFNLESEINIIDTGASGYRVHERSYSMEANFDIFTNSHWLRCCINSFFVQQSGIDQTVTLKRVCWMLVPILVYKTVNQPKDPQNGFQALPTILCLS